MEEKYKVSVLMGIYNCAPTLPKSIESIINQTYTNWELIMVNDGSTDNTLAIAKEYESKYPDKIKVYENEKNMGLNFTLNHCLKEATGDIVARQDGDDISVPERFEKQVAELIKQPNVQIISSEWLCFDEKGPWKRSTVIPYPQPIDVVKGSPIGHASSMMWKYCMDEVGGYTVDKRLLRVEDVDLWLKLYAKGYRCYNIPEPLYEVFDGRDAINRRKYKYRINSTYARLLGCKRMNMGLKTKLYCFKPMIIGLCPGWLRREIKKIQYKDSYK